MHIALINDFPPYTGLGNYAYSLFSRFQHAGVNAEMLYLGEPEARMQGITSLGQGIFPFMKKTLNNLFYYPGKIPNGFDIYHASNQFLAACSAKRRQSVVTCLDIIPAVMGNDYPFAVRLALSAAMKKMASAGRIIAISEHTKKDLLRFIDYEPERIDVIPLGLDPSIFRPMGPHGARAKLGLSQSAKIILNVGSGERRKNIPVLMDAFSEILRSFPDATLVRVGDESRENLNYAKKLGIAQNILWAREKDKSRLALYYNACDVFAFPSLYEGFGMPPVEAMACGKPVVAADATSLPEVVGDAAVLAKPDDSRMFADAVCQLLGNPKKAASLAAKGLERSKMFHWEKIAEQTIKTYERVQGAL